MFRTALLTIIILLLISSKSYSQIPNGSFENWSNGHPTGWHYHNETPFNCMSQDINAFEGSSAVRSTLVQPGPVVIYDGLITGNFDPTNPSFSVANGFIPINNKPSKLFGWYILQNNSIDTFTVMIDLKKNGTIIGSGDFSTLNETSLYTQFAVDINYSSAEIPDSFQIVITYNHRSYQVNSGNAGAYFIVDSLNFDLTSSINELSNNKTNIKVFPNPTNQQLTFQQLNEQAIERICIFDPSGKIIETLEPNAFYCNLNLDNYEAGAYLYHIWLENSLPISGHFIKL